MFAYTVTIFLSAFLLFQVQLIVAKYILPWFGGSAAVWTTSLLFFQLLLLAGYTYSHLIVNRLKLRWQAVFHITLLLVSLVLLVILCFSWGSPILASRSWRPADGVHPVGSIFVLLATSIGLPFLLLSSTSPLLQRWFGRLYLAHSPYRLYAISNLGSLLALLSYPFLIEPALALRTQAWIWSALYAAFTAISVFCATRLSGSVSKGSPARDSETKASEPLSPRSEVSHPRGVTYVIWFSLAFCASTLLLAMTNQISQEVAVVPFLWVLPLSLYLLSFTICFHRDSWYWRRFYLTLLAAGTVLSCDILSASLQRTIVSQILIFSLTLFAACMVCHGELVRKRPAERHLTTFYLLVAAGGASGGVFVASIAPSLFSGYWELHLGLLLSWFLVACVLLGERGSFLYRPSPASAVACLFVLLAAIVFLSAQVLWGSFQAVAGDTHFYYGVTGLYAMASDALGKHNLKFPRWSIPWFSIFIALGVSGTVFLASGTSKKPASFMRNALWPRLIFLGLVATLSLFLWQNVGQYYRNTLQVSRSFYGVAKVVEEENRLTGPRYALFNGQTLHGAQYINQRRLPTTYFGDRSGIGILLVNYEGNPQAEGENRGRRFAVLGLGVGTLAVYGNPKDAFCFYEINPDVIRLARGEGGYFSYLRDTQAKINVVEGDARVSLERELGESGSRQFDVMVLDVFTSDSIPAHLLTREAFEIYLEHLKTPQGVLAIHITNRFLDLKPVLWGVADHFGLHKALVRSIASDSTQQNATWVFLSRDERNFTEPPISLVSSSQKEVIEPLLWTDDFSNLFQVVKW